MYLGLWGRLLILVAGGSFVVVAVVIVACFVGPGCWGFEYLQRKENKKKKRSIEKIQSKLPINFQPKSGYYWLEDNDYVIYETGPRGFEAKLSKINEVPQCHSKERVFNLKCAPLLVAPNLYSTVNNSTPKLEVKLFYSSSDDEDVEGRLTVKIISATFLPTREYIATLDSFVKLEVINNKWSLQKSERIVRTMCTGVVKNSLNPTFDETYVVDVKEIEMKNWCLKFTILDDDRLTKITPLFERRIHLKEIKNLTTPNHNPFSLEMQEVMANMGALFFGISYLPTAQRLNISIIKAVKLKYQSFVHSLIEFYPYVRVVMVNNHGKCIRKKKTCCRPKDENPVFNHSLMFDLSISNLEQTVFLILLCAKALNQHNSDDSSLDGDIETSLSESKDKVLGTVVLGRNVRCTKARDHWVAVMQNPRKMISVWHDLKAANGVDTYRAAVVEYFPVLTKDEESRVASNVENYKSFIESAKKEDADIIVFPENGLLTKTIHSPLPDPSEQIAPCDSPTFITTEIVKNLSCASKENKIYSIVNLLEKRSCSKDDHNCPPRGYYIYNTNVGFDRGGTIVARYSKFNLYDEALTNKTERPEIVYFDMDFGVRFGTFVCFDIMFPNPSFKLLQSCNVTDFVYSTYWFSELPFLTALQIQRGWAETNNVNLLASGMNFPLTATFGSGIYNGKFGDLIQIMPEIQTSKLLIADVPKIKTIGQRQKTDLFSKVISFPSPSPEVVLPSFTSMELFGVELRNTSEEGIELLKDHMELFQSEIIETGKRFDRKICSGDGFCCNFQVSVDALSPESKNYFPRAIVFNGVRKFGLSFNGGVQCCGVVLCKGPEIRNCTSRVKKISGVFKFKEIQIKGDFRLEDSFQIPTTLTDGERLEPLSANKYEFIKSRKDKSVEVSLELIWPITNLQTFGIWGTDFTRDMASSAPGVMRIPTLFTAFVLLATVFTNFL